jgi:hypothetical protein
MIHASIGPWLSIDGRTISPTFAKTFSFDQGDWPTKCSSDWCCAAVRSGRRYGRRRLDALALARHYQAKAISPQWAGSVCMSDHTPESFDICRKSCFTAVCRLEIHTSPSC